MENKRYGPLVEVTYSCWGCVFYKKTEGTVPYEGDMACHEPSITSQFGGVPQVTSGHHPHGICPYMVERH